MRFAIERDEQGRYNVVASSGVVMARNLTRGVAEREATALNGIMNARSTHRFEDGIVRAPTHKE